MYIEREAFWKAFYISLDEWCKGRTVKRILDEIPAADVVEVVRCRDCVRRYSENLCPMCFLINGDFYEYTNGNGFCDRGERREPDA